VRNKVLIRLYGGLAFSISLFLFILDRSFLRWVVPVALGIFLVLIFLSVLFLFAVSMFYQKRTPVVKDDPFCRSLAYHTMDCILTLFRFRPIGIGLEKIPPKPCVLVCNHLSRFDPMVSFVLLKGRRLGFVSKKENMQIPIVGPITHRIGFVSLDRENPLRAMRTIHSAAKLVSEKGFTLGIYPEGTRSKSGALLDFKPGAFVLAKKALVPIVICTITGTGNHSRKFPFKKTAARFRVLRVLSAQTVKEMSAEELGELCREEIRSELSKSTES